MLAKITMKKGRGGHLYDRDLYVAVPQEKIKSTMFLQGEFCGGATNTIWPGVPDVFPPKVRNAIVAALKAMAAARGFKGGYSDTIGLLMMDMVNKKERAFDLNVAK